MGSNFTGDYQKGDPYGKDKSNLNWIRPFTSDSMVILTRDNILRSRNALQTLKIEVLKCRGPLRYFIDK